MLAHAFCMSTLRTHMYMCAITEDQFHSLHTLADISFHVSICMYTIIAGKRDLVLVLIFILILYEHVDTDEWEDMDDDNDSSSCGTASDMNEYMEDDGEMVGS